MSDAHRVDLERLVDVHCHPNDAFGGTDPARVAKAIDGLRIGKLCVMSSSLESQSLTAQLFEKRPRRIVAGFGLHPWWSHTVTFEPGQGYEELLPSLDRPDGDGWLKPHLTARTDFRMFMDQLKNHLLAVPGSILGEVGLDKSFKIQVLKADGEWRRSTVRVPIDHQRKVLDAQLDLAVQLGKNVSIHAVQCTAEIIEVFEGLERRWGERLTGPKMISRRKSQRERKTVECGTGCGGEGKIEKGIKIDWHSAFVSVETLQSVVKKFPEIMYFSYAFTLFEDRNLEKLDQLIQHTPDDRLMIESDWGSDPGLIDGKLEEMVHRIMKVKGWDAENCVRQLEENWSRFSGCESL